MCGVLRWPTCASSTRSTRPLASASDQAVQARSANLSISATDVHRTDTHHCGLRIASVTFAALLTMRPSCAVMFTVKLKVVVY